MENNFLRMEPAMFLKLLNGLGGILTKSTKQRDSLEPRLKLEILLRHLTSCQSHRSLAHNIKCCFTRDVCEAIIAEWLMGHPCLFNHMHFRFSQDLTFTNQEGEINKPKYLYVYSMKDIE